MYSHVFVQVSQDIETLQRRKRRLHPTGRNVPEATSAPAMLDMWKVMHSQVGIEKAQPVGVSKPQAPENGISTFSHDGPRVFQPSSREPGLSSVPFQREQSSDVDELRRFRSFTFEGNEEDHLLQCSPSHPPPPPKFPLHLYPVGSSTQAHGDGFEDVSLLQTFAPVRQRWTAPPNLPLREHTDFHLLRFMDGTDEPSQRPSTSGTSQRLLKRTRRTDFWDARLMR